MKIQLLPTSFDDAGKASNRQHLACFVIDDTVALDAGSLATSTTAVQKERIRNVILTHAHLDHIAGLPLFVDDCFATLREPVVVHATEQVIEVLESNIFNWAVYPRFSELENEFGKVLRYEIIQPEKIHLVEHLKVEAIKVNHKVPSVGFIIDGGEAKFALTGDTAEVDWFWDRINQENSLQALFIECAFPDEMEELSRNSHHLTPRRLNAELKKFNRKDCPVFIINIKPTYYSSVCEQILALNLANIEIMQPGKIYKI